MTGNGGRQSAVPAAVFGELTFQRVTQADPGLVETLSRVATQIVREFYDPLLGTAQNDYMLEKFQSVRAIKDQPARRYRYCLVCGGGEILGFLGFYPRHDALYLSKLYLYREQRGKGYGRRMLDFLCGQAHALGLTAIELNVNKHNPTIAVYERLGFVRVRREVNDIGAGWVMDDYVYRLELG